MRALPLAASLAMMLSPLALAQTHEHMSGEGMAMVLHDGPASGRAVVGGLTHFGFALLDPSGAPAVHRNAAFQVVEDGLTVFQTNDTHEYDGLFSFDYTFTHAGHYVVTASSDKMNTTTFEGDAVMPANASVAKVVFQNGGTGMDDLVKGTIRIVDPSGALLDHTDAWVEFRELGSDRLVARAHFHQHSAPIQFEQALPTTGPMGGDFTMQVTAYRAYPTGLAGDVEAVLQSFPVHVGAAFAPVAPQPPGQPAVMSPMGANATKDGVTLYGMYDPQDQQAIGFPIRFSGLIEDATMMPLAHVDFSFMLTGPRGEVFSSKSLHEYGGVFEYLYVPDVPGLYDGLLTANVGGSTLSVPYHFQAVPPVSPLSMSPGVATVTVQGLDKATAGVPTDLTFDVAGPAGAVQHSEVDVTIAQKGQPALYQFKMHTHESGTTRATVVFPSAGDWIVHVDAAPTSPDPVVFVGPGGIGAPIEFAAKVAPGEAMAVQPQTQTSATKSVPALDVAALVGGAALLALALRRR